MHHIFTQVTSLEALHGHADGLLGIGLQTELNQKLNNFVNRRLIESGSRRGDGEIIRKGFVVKQGISLNL
jgi:hypothetical protein